MPSRCSTSPSQTSSRCSARGLLSILNEPIPDLKGHALGQLNSFVHLFWPEISTSVPVIESLSEDEEFEHRELALLFVSKEFYYLGELNNSLSYAIGAGSLFDVSEYSDYAHTLLDRKHNSIFSYVLLLMAKAIDEYASIKSKPANQQEKLDPRLEAIVERMLDKCTLDGKYQQAMGMAVECRRLDKLEEAITRSDNVNGALSYCVNLSHSFVNHREYRCEGSR